MYTAGVVLSEIAGRDSVGFRMLVKLLEFLLPDHKIPKRLPAGKSEIIANAPRQRVVDFYEAFYNPEKITFIVCGDAEPEEMEKRIIETYGSMTSKKAQVRNGQADVDLGSVTTGLGFRTAVLADDELVSDELMLTFARPHDDVADTTSDRHKKRSLDLAHSILSRRLQTEAKKEGSPFRSGYASSDGYSWLLRNGASQGTISVTPVSGDDNWKACIPIIEQEFRRVMQHGFAPYELEEAKANLLSNYKRAADAAATRTSQSLATVLVDSIMNRFVVSTPEENLRIVEEGIASITINIVHEAFKIFWDTTDLNLVLLTKEEASDTTDVMEQIYAESQKIEVDSPDTDWDMEWEYTSFGPQGEVVSDTTQDDLAIRQLVLSNNIRVNLKSTDFQANTVQLSAQFGTGVLGQDPSKPGIQWPTSIMMDRGGLGKHSKDDLGRILAGRQVGAEFSVYEGAFVLSGGTTSDDLELQLQLMAAHLSDPGFRPEALLYWKQVIPSYVTHFKNGLDGALYYVNTFLKGDDGRFAVPSPEGMDALTISDVQDWLKPQLDESYLELSVIGDFDVDSTIPLILKTFGALPERQDSPVIDRKLRNLEFPTTPGEKTFTYESKFPHAAAMVVFDVPSLEDDISLTRRINVLSSILNDRMRIEIREEQGESYSPSAYSDISTDFDYGVITALARGTPESSEAVSRSIIAIAGNVTKDVTDDELVRAVNPKLSNIEALQRSNSYWLNSVMRESQVKPWHLNWSRNMYEDYSSITLDEIKAIASKYLSPENSMRITILPVATGDEQ